MSVNLVNRQAGMSREMFVKWGRYIESRHTYRTIKHYKMVIWRFAKYCPQQIIHLTREHIERYLASIRGTNRTKNAHLTVIKAFCRWLEEYYEYPNTCEKIRMLKEDPPKQRVLSEEEYRKVLSVCEPIEADAIQFLANTGLRKSEFQSLSWSNIRDDMKLLKIVGKGRKQRVVPLNETCRKILDRYRNPQDYTINFVESYCKWNNLYVLCSRLAKKANIPRFGPHSLRHFFCTQMYRKGQPLHITSKILGHADTRTTERIYCHLLDTDFIGSTNCLD